MEITMGKAWSYLHKVAEARIKLIEAVKDDLKQYQGELVETMIDTELPVELVKLDQLKPLYEVDVPREILDALGEDCQIEPAFANYVYKFVVIDGIKLKLSDAVRANKEEEVA